MTIEELFKKSENGTLTYEQFTQLAGTAKFADLSEGNYVSKQKYTDELASRDTRITTLTDTITTRDTDLANLQEQLKNAGTDTEKLNDVNTKFSDLQKQYDKDTKAYQKQLKEQAYKFAVKEFANSKKFTSNAAKRDFVNSMLSKNLQMENDRIIGAEDFVSMYLQENDDAFVKEQQQTPDEPTAHQKPVFVTSTQDKTPVPEDVTGGFGKAFNFNFVHPPKQQN